LVYTKHNHHNGFITSLAISRNSEYILSSGLDNKVYLIDTLKGQILTEVHNSDPVETILTLGFSDCGNFIYTGGSGGIVYLYKIVEIKDDVNNKNQISVL